MGVNGKLATLGKALDKIRDMAPTITVDNLRFLIAIAERPGLTVPELAAQLGVSRVGAYERTKRLKTAGLVESRMGAHPRETTLTEKGRVAIRALRGV